jgi:very-short-patch-repair endonuclease
MSDQSESPDAGVEESNGTASILPPRSDFRASLSDSRLAGSIVRFQPVVGAGDVELARLAELQHGHVHLKQLRAAGLKRGAVAGRVATGRLHQTLPGVFLVGRPHADLLGRMMAAALYFQGDALVTGQPGAQLWGMLDTTQQPCDKDPIRMLLPDRNATPPPGVFVRRTGSIARQDVRWRRGIPVTSPARTLLDLAGLMGAMELEAVLGTAFRQNLVRRSNLADVMQRNPHAKGIRTLRWLLDESGASLHDTRSKYERRFLRLLRAAELPLPITNTWVAGKFVDGVWPELKLVLEIDGFKDHGKRHKFESDRERDQVLLSTGQQPLRVTARQIDHRPYALVARTASVIVARRLALDTSVPSV